MLQTQKKSQQPLKELQHGQSLSCHCRWIQSLEADHLSKQILMFAGLTAWSPLEQVLVQLVRVQLQLASDHTSFHLAA
jgi:hypothetical protein